ncbi:MAG: UBP-type zinc finger domain-containing protein [Actinomycetota bacterium]
MSFLRSETAQCTHVPATKAEPRAEACEACGSRVNLRVCAECGHVGCCESQAGHNRVHALDAGHPVIIQMPIGTRSFTWCYDCNRYV